MTPRERKAFEALSKYDTQPGTPEEIQADKRRWIVREFGPKALDGADLLIGLIQKAEAFEAMREALKLWPHRLGDIGCGRPWRCGCECCIKARAALALADRISNE